MYAIENEKTKAYLDEIIEVSKKHGLSLGHEDIGGAFLLYPYSNKKTEWLEECLLGEEWDSNTNHYVPILKDVL